MPFSLILIMVLAAMTEELVKAAGFIGLISHRYPPLTWKVVIFSSILIGLGFLLGEKLLLFITLSQIADSIFGAASVSLNWPSLDSVSSFMQAPPFAPVQY